MRKKVQDIGKIFLTQKAFCILTIAAFLFFIIPLLYAGRYNHAASDDYWFAFHSHCSWLNTHNLLKVFITAVRESAQFYVNWQGTYSSVFFMALSPFAFGEQYAHAVPYIMIGMTCISTMILMYAVLNKWLGLNGYTCVSATMAACIMQCAFMYTPASGLYWWNAAVHYVFMQGFWNLMVGFALLSFERMYHDRGRRIWRSLEMAACTVAAFMAAGGNFSTALLTAEMLVLLEILSVVLWRIQKKKCYFWFFIPFLVGEAGFLVNILAPGNAVRQGYFKKGSVFEAIGNSFSYSFSQMLLWVTIWVIVILVVLLPVFLRAVMNSRYSFRFPLLVTGLGYCLYVSMFTPGFYAMGVEPLSRNQNICKMFLLLFLVFLEAYWCGWLVHKVKAVKAFVPVHGKNVLIWTAVLSLALLTGTVCFARLDFVSKQANFVNYGAWLVSTDGRGQRYWNEYLNRLLLYRNDDKIVYVQPYSDHPYPLWVSSDTEESIDESGKISAQVALWYAKDAIYEIK
ncbi:MAG: hypothetical protein K2K63_14055 [Acetatifactor sp.]|nr:hypothetical protein [Acetatifactor sp.]